ncbi:MAG: NUDIX hydrolase [Desulfobacterales bacterium]|nr:NUDIX hydrolase [Desulfobacterales bacterium]
MKRWKKEPATEIYRNRMFALKRTRCRHPEKGVVHDFFSIDAGDWINVVATTEGGRFVLVRQHRLGIDEITLEIPGGMVDPGDTPEQSATRELAEETGYRAGRMTLLKTLSANPAILTNRLHVFHAAGCVRCGDQHLDAAEDIEVELVTRAEILEMLRNGDIHHSLVVAALGLYFLSETGVL